MKSKTLWIGLLGASVVGAAAGCSHTRSDYKLSSINDKDGYYVTWDEAKQRGGIGSYVERPTSQEEKAEKDAVAYREKIAHQQQVVADVQKELHFKTDSAELTPSAEQKLGELAQMMKENPEYVLSVTGFTDSTGPERLNDHLSNERAGVVQMTLLSLGVNPTQVLAIGEGENFPIASNDTDQGRAMNRRADLKLTV